MITYLILNRKIGNTGLSFENFEKLIVITKNTIENIARFDAELGKIKSVQNQMCRIDALCETYLVKIASENGAYLLIQKLKDLKYSTQ